MPTIYYYYYFRENNVEYFLPIRKEIPLGHKIKLDYFHNQLLEQLQSKFKNVRRTGHHTYGGQEIEQIDRYLHTFSNANRKNLMIHRKYYDEKGSFTIRPEPVPVYYFGENNSSTLQPIDIEVCDRNYYLRLQRRFRPTEIKLLFLLESPPISGNYFYDIRGAITEHLYNEMMKAFSISATTKAEGLEQFKNKGLFLIDATYRHVDAIANDNLRISEILRDEENLLRDLDILDREEHIPIILIKCNIYDIYKSKLSENGFNIVNGDNRIPFPSNGRQAEFHEKLKAVLQNLNSRKETK